MLDCADLRDFSGITGNLAKFGLGTISILFDITFLLQHYVLYVETEEMPESEPLLSPDERQETAEQPELLRV